MALASVSCKKEYASYPYNAIETFVTADPSGTTLSAAIVDDNIIIYWPPLQPVPDSITPVIGISKKASIMPASGVKVAFSETTTYIVTAQDGKTRTFTLKPSVNQPNISFEDPDGNKLQIGAWFNLLGEYYITDTTKTKLYLLNDRNNKVIQLPLSAASIFTYSRITIAVPFDGTVDTGYYHMQLVSGERSVTKGPYYVDRPFMINAGYTFPARGSILHRGEEITVTYDANAAGAKYWNNAFAYGYMIVNGLSDNRMDIINQAPGQVSLRIPDDMRLGSVDRVFLYSEPYIPGAGADVEVFFAESPADYITIKP
jgi:hypothetical protein